MAKKQLSAEQKRLDTDIWIIALVTMGIFFCYATMGNQMMGIVKDNSIPVILRLLFNAGVQFGIAGLGITIVCILRKETFIQFGLKKENIIKAILGTILCFLPYICYIFISGQFSGYRPLGIF